MQSAITRKGAGLGGSRPAGVAIILADRGTAGPCCVAKPGGSEPRSSATSASGASLARHAHPRNHRHRGPSATPPAAAAGTAAPSAGRGISCEAWSAREWGAAVVAAATPAVLQGSTATGATACRLTLLHHRRPSYSRGRRVSRHAGVLEGFSGVSNLMAPEFATVFSAIIAITSVSINLYGGLLTEKRRAELAREVERERQLMAAADEERSVVARYRGPLLEATVDLEARLYHIATLTAEWRSGDVVCEEEVVYTLFTLSQWLGFLEVIRREGPRERSFLQRGGGTQAAAATAGKGGGGGGACGSTGGTDTLTTLVESFRFVLSAHPATLRKWYEQGDEREHPGCRSRALMLRGSPALPDDWSDAAAAAAAYGSGGYWRERPPPPPMPLGAAWPVAAATGGGAAPVVGGGFAQPYGPMRGGGAGTGGPNGSYGAALPPPPTKRVMLYDSGPAARGPVPATGAVVGSELVIGSLDENDLAAAGLGLPDVDPTGAEDSTLSCDGITQAPSLAGAAASGTGIGAANPLSLASGVPLPVLPTGRAWDAATAAAAAAAAVAAADLYGSSLSSLGSLSSLSSLSSFDEGGFSLQPAAAAAAAPASAVGGGRRRRRASAPRDVFHVSRGAQRSIGSMMVVTPMGASRHYTLSYGDFYNRYYLDDFFASWLRPVHTDILALVGGRRWRGQEPFPLNRWTRLLLLQQLLVETIELLDPEHVRVPANRRVVLAPVHYKQAPELEAYRARMQEMSRLESPLLMQQLQEGQAGGPMGRLLASLRGAASAASSAVAAITAGTDTPASASPPPLPPSPPVAATLPPPAEATSWNGVSGPPLTPPPPPPPEQQRPREEAAVQSAGGARVADRG